jgi:methanol metabolism-related c-type cytochrome
VKSENGKYLDKEGNPTFKVGSDGAVDWYTYSGFRRYHSECHVCHGPDGMGSTYAPALKDSLKTMSYADFLGVVATGRQNVSSSQENVMPAFGDNQNVVCYLDDLYVYLRARANDAVGRGRPAKHEDKPPAVQKAEDACMAQK